MGAALLAFCAGYVNAVALSGFVNRSASHITGTVTQGACLFGQSDFRGGWAALVVVLAFFTGATLSGIIVKNEQLQIGRRYGVALLIESGLLFLSTALFCHGWFSGELVASGACGLQNALVATYSGSVIRTTHLTGILSDLGSAFGCFLAGRRVNRPQVKLHMSILLAFLIGAFAGSVIFHTIRYLSLLIPATVIAGAGISYMTYILRTVPIPESTSTDSQQR